MFSLFLINSRAVGSDCALKIPKRGGQCRLVRQSMTCAGAAKPVMGALVSGWRRACPGLPDARLAGQQGILMASSRSHLMTHDTATSKCFTHLNYWKNEGEKKIL